MGALLEKKTGHQAKLEKGSGGIFEVSVHGQVVAQKGPSGFPSDDEIVAAVEASLAK